MKVCAITYKSANFGKTRRHRRGSAGGVSGAWSKKAQAMPKKQNVNLKRIKVIDAKNRVSTINVSMKAYKKARQNQGKLSSEYKIANYHESLNK